MQSEMPQEPTPISPLTALRRHWFVAGVLIVLGLLAGIVAGSSRPVTFTAQARLVVGGQQIASFQVPGYALAAQQVAANYARYVGLPQSQARFHTVLGADARKVDSVTGSPIAESNVVLIEVMSTSPEVSARAADTVAADLAKQANTPTTEPSSYLAFYKSISAKLYHVQGQLTVARQRLAVLTVHKAGVAVLQTQQQLVDGLATTLSTLGVEQTTAAAQYSTSITSAATYTRLETAQPAVITLTSKRSTIERYGVGGLALGLVAALACASLLERRGAKGGRRLRGDVGFHAHSAGRPRS